jgi:hypothetical protein
MQIIIKILAEKKEEKAKSSDKPWNTNYQFYKNYFIYSNENKQFNELFKKYSMMKKDDVIVN